MPVNMGAVKVLRFAVMLCARQTLGNMAKTKTTTTGERVSCRSAAERAAVRW